MAWNKALPANNEKIRNLGVVIRPNWEAIEEGDDVGTGNMLQMRSVQLDNRTGLAANNDPQTNAGTHYLYSKEDGGGVQEGYMKDSAGNIVQLTNDGKIGATDVNFDADSISFDGTITYNENNMYRAWGLTDATGSAFALNRGFVGISNISTGVYEIDITGMASGGGNFPSISSYGVMVSLNPSPLVLGRLAYVLTKTVTSFRIQITSLSGSVINDSVAIGLLT